MAAKHDISATSTSAIDGCGRDASFTTTTP
jgi:hypothetical protein